MSKHNLFRRFQYALYERFPFPSISYDENVEIDVVIPAIEKDIQILPLCIEGVKRNVVHKIKTIYIVAPENESIRSFCKRQELVYVEESSIMGLSPKDLNLIVIKDGKKINRSGWLFQQLIKLSGKVGTCDNYLCIDADHILLRKHVFIDGNNIPVFYMSSENNKAYYANIAKLIGLKVNSPLSYVAHKMIFNKRELRNLHQIIEGKCGVNWVQAILNSYDRREASGFSEFELYGNFIQNKHRRPWCQQALSYSELRNYDELQRDYAKQYQSITFPEYFKISFSH